MFKLKFFAEMLLVILMAAALLTPLMLEQVITQKLNAGKDVSTGRVKIMPLTRSVTITDIKVQKIALNNGYLAAGTVPELKIHGIPVWGLLRNREISIGKVVCQSPILRISWDSLANVPVSDAGPGKLNLEKIKSLIIFDGNVSLSDSTGGIYFLEHVQFELSPVFLNRDPVTSEVEFDIKTGKLQYHSSDSIHLLSVSKLRASSETKEIILDSVKVIPSYSEAEFRKHIPYQAERFQLDCPVITVTLHKDEWIKDNHFHLNKIVVESLQLKAFRDKRIPRNPDKNYKLLQFYLARSRTNMIIDTFLVNNAVVTYRERAEESNETGEIVFSNTAILASNLVLGESNQKELKIELKASFMKSSTLNGTLRFPYQKNYFLCGGELKNLPMVEANSISEPVAGFVFNSGEVHSLTFNFIAYDAYAAGDLELRYDNLDFTIKNSPAGDSTSFMSKVKTIATSLFMKKESRSENEMVISAGEICNARRTDRFIFNYMWKSILSGIKSAMSGTIGEELTSGGKSPC